MLTRKSKYGLKALLLLAREYARGPILASELAAREGIPEKFLQAILLDLGRRGIVGSKRGKGGGYQLARDPAAIDFGEVIRVLDGPLALIPCVSQTAYRKCDECDDERRCGIRLVMKDVRDATARILEDFTLADVNRAVDRLSDTPRALKAAQRAIGDERKAAGGGRRAGGKRKAPRQA